MHNVLLLFFLKLYIFGNITLTKQRMEYKSIMQTFPLRKLEQPIEKQTTTSVGTLVLN